MLMHYVMQQCGGEKENSPQHNREETEGANSALDPADRRTTASSGHPEI